MDKRLPLSNDVMLDRERCIICRRCVRFQDEIAGEKEIEMIQRGWETYIGCAEGEEFTSIFSGNTIDICPVGALTDRTWRFQARPWELEHHETTCAKCAVGCSIHIGSRDNKPLRVIAAENEQVNDVWICDTGKFHMLDFAKTENRITTPLIRQDNELTETSWDEALAFIAQRFSEIGNDADAFGFVGSASMTNEEAYMMQRFARTVIGTNNVDFTERDQAVSTYATDGGTYGLPLNVTTLREADVIVTLGCDLYHHLPIAWLWVAQAVMKNDAKLAAIGVDDPERRMQRHSWKWLPGQNGGMNRAARALAKSVVDAKGTTDPDAARVRTLEDLCVMAKLDIEEMRDLGKALAAAERPVILCGSGHDNETVAPELVSALAELLNADGWRGVGYCVHHANERGCFESGLAPGLLPGIKSVKDVPARTAARQLWGANVPETDGLDAQTMLRQAHSGDLKVLWLVDGTPTVLGNRTNGGLFGAELVIVQAQTMTELTALAHVVLPDQAIAERNGNYTNISGLTQAIRRTVIPPASARSSAVVLRELANLLGVALDYVNPQATFAEMEKLCQLSGLAESVENSGN